jgi:hypothetical protein
VFHGGPLNKKKPAPIFVLVDYKLSVSWTNIILLKPNLESKFKIKKIANFRVFLGPVKYSLPSFTRTRP